MAALDELCGRLGVRRLPGLHCYDLLAGPSRVAALFAAEPGTYLLTDFLVRSFRRSVLADLGLDRHPELWPDYFGHYRRVVWLAQSPEPSLEAEARAVAAMFGLPLTIVPTGTARLEYELEQLLGECVQTTAVETTDRFRTHFRISGGRGMKWDTDGQCLAASGMAKEAGWRAAG